MALNADEPVVAARMTTGARIAAALTSPVTALVAVIVAATALRLLWLDVPAHTYFDEKFYVNAARSILGWAGDTGFTSSIAGLDPNQQHPPLGKVVIALSMSVFGDTGLGWRLPSLVAGTVSLLTVYGVVRALGASAWTGVLAAAILALDVLTFVHARIAMLDGLLVACMLVGAWLALRRWWVPAGIALAAATLVKVGGVLGLAVVVLWILWSGVRKDGRAGLHAAVVPVLLVVGTYAVVTLGGLWLLDLRFTTWTDPFSHIVAMLGFGIDLRPGIAPGIAASPYMSRPWEWLTFGGQINYYNYQMMQAIGLDMTGVPRLIVRGVLNPVLLAMVAIVVALSVYRIRRDDADPERWSLLWMGAAFLPWVIVVFVSSRPMYLYYMLPAVPGIAIATAAVLRRFPTWVAWAYLIAMLAGFAFYFPFKGVP